MDNEFDLFHSGQSMNVQHDRDILVLSDCAVSEKAQVCNKI